MANVITPNADITSRYTALTAAQTLGRADFVTVTGDTAIAAPTQGDPAAGYYIYGMATAVVPVVITAAGSITVNLWAGYESEIDGDMRWAILASASAQTITDNGGWILPSGGATKLAVQVVIAAGTPDFSIIIGGTP